MLDWRARWQDLDEFTMNDLNFLSVVEMAEQVRTRAVSPVELVDAHLGRIAELNCGRESNLNAFVHVDVERARERAKIRGSSGWVPLACGFSGRAAWRTDFCEELGGRGGVALRVWEPIASGIRTCGGCDAGDPIARCWGDFAGEYECAGIFDGL